MLMFPLHVASNARPRERGSLSCDIPSDSKSKYNKPELEHAK